MSGEERRKEIVRLIAESRSPVSGTEIARQLGVSRQVIVQDIALLRAVDRNILSTNKGYIAGDSNASKASRNYRLTGTTEQIKDQVSIIRNAGGKISDVNVLAGSEEVFMKIDDELLSRGYYGN